MHSKSIGAYDIPGRVAAYDADMDVMHPLRHKMIEIAFEILPFGSDQAITAIDLGVGTGLFTRRFLEQFPQSRITAVDGAASMIELATSRLGELADRVTFVVGDFRDLGGLLGEIGPVDLVFSAYALHHLNRDEKVVTIRRALQLIKRRGWFVNADLVAAESEEVESRVQDLRVEGIVRRAATGDERFTDHAAVRAFLDNLEATEGDQPLALAEELELVREAGLHSVEVFWKEYRELVYGGPTG